MLMVVAMTPGKVELMVLTGVGMAGDLEVKCWVTITMEMLPPN